MGCSRLGLRVPTKVVVFRERFDYEEVCDWIAYDRGSMLILGLDTFGAAKENNLVGKGVLVMSSRFKVHVLLGRMLRGRKCSACRTTGKIRTLSVISGRSPSLILLSVGVPKVSKVRVLGEVEIISGSVHIVVVATCNRLSVVRRTGSLKTLARFTGPFSVSSVETTMGGCLPIPGSGWSGVGHFWPRVPSLWG